jgi:hypothetical protein
VMRKMGRDISEARPDITHQVRTRGHVHIVISAWLTWLVSVFLRSSIRLSTRRASSRSTFRHQRMYSSE